MLSFMLVSMHTSPLAHAGVLGGPLAQRHECADHVHQTSDRHEAPQPKAILQNVIVIQYVSVKHVVETDVIWEKPSESFGLFTDKISHSLPISPTTPPPTA
jgi:hypothetical protein